MTQYYFPSQRDDTSHSLLRTETIMQWSMVPTIYDGNVFSVPGSGRCVKGPSSTPRLSICSNSFAYRFRFFLPISPAPDPEGSHSFLIQRAHLCRSVST